MIGDDLLEKFGRRDMDHDARKAGFIAYYDAVNKQLNESSFADRMLFLNFGYAANEAEQRAVVQASRYFPNRNSAQLVLELIGDQDIAGKHVLDVGCGRGGLLSLLHMVFKPAGLSGVDLSPEAVAFAARTQVEPLFDFKQGDAENLPHPAASFDIVTNVESSHSYPDIGKFYAEVHRVLKPGGWFLYTDVLSADEWNFGRSALKKLGFELTRDCDITSNVLLSQDQIVAQRDKSFPDWRERESGNGFVKTPEHMEVFNSRVFQDMRDNACEYRILWFHNAAADTSDQ